MRKNLIIESKEKHRILNLHKMFLKEDITNSFDVASEAGGGGSSNVADSFDTAEEQKSGGNTPPPPKIPRGDSVRNCYTDKYVREAQELLKVKVDGKFGPVTLQAMKDKMSTTAKVEPSTASTASTATVTTKEPESSTEKKSDVTAGLNEPVSGSAPEQNKGESATADSLEGV